MKLKLTDNSVEPEDGGRVVVKSRGVNVRPNPRTRHEFFWVRVGP